MYLLKVPAVFTAVRIDRHDRRCKQVVTGANGAVEIRSGVTGRKVDEPELGIDGRRLPHRCAAAAPDLVVLRPGVVTEFPRPRYRMEGPYE